MSDEITVQLGLLRRYLEFRGWHRAEIAGGKAASFDGTSYADAFFRERSNGRRNFDLYTLSDPGLDDIELVVPRELGSTDASRRLDGAIETLSQLEGKDRLQIIADVRSIGFDVWKSRIPDELVYEDTIYLDQAVNYTRGVKKLLASGATTEMAPDAYFLRVKKEGMQYAEQCRFGHTFRGSFGFTIESPIQPNTQTVLAGMDQSPPFERRVIQRLARGIGVIQEAVRADDQSIVVGGYRIGFNANMLDDFASLVEETAGIGMAFGFTLSPEWPAPEIAELRVGPQHVEMCRVAAKAMKERPISVPLEVVGRIIRLQNEADPTDLLDETHEREIVVHWESEEFGELNVKMSLAPNDYLAAVDAHRHGRPIRVKGRLQRQGNRWLLTDPSDFSL